MPVLVVPRVPLRSGGKMPLVGLGTWLSSQLDIRGAISSALEAGYRHIDTAYAYGNESAIGEVLEEWTQGGRVKREDLFVVTKLPSIGNRPESVSRYLDESLKNLRLTYVDLYLIHSPVGLNDRGDGTLTPIKEDGSADLDCRTDLVSLWKGMEDQVKTGKTKAIGLSNFNVEQIQRILEHCEIPPDNLQVELHAYLQQRELREVCAENGITVCAYGPLGSPGRFQLYTKNNVSVATIPVDLMSHGKVKRIAEKYGKTTAQVLLRHLTQQNVVVIPKSITPERIAENIQIFDFSLTEEELKELDSLDRGEAGRSFLFKMPPGLEKHPEYPLRDTESTSAVAGSIV